jgi:outer membrane protein
MRPFAQAFLLLLPSAALAAETAPPFEAGVASGGAPLALQDALRTALDKSPIVRELAEAVPQAKAQRDKALAFILPQGSIGAQYRINDREIAFDPADGFDTSSLTDGFAGIYQSLAYVYGELIEGTIIEIPAECDEAAIANGFADCAEMLAAFDQGLEPDGGETPSTDPIVIQPRSQGFLSLSGTWPVSIRAIPMFQAGSQGVIAAEKSVEKAKNDLMLGVVRAYSGAFTAQEALRILRDQVAIAEAHEKDVQALLAAGIVTRDNLLRAQIEVEKIHRQVRDAEAGLRMARRFLALAMGVRPDEFGPVQTMPEFTIPTESAEQWRIAAAESRPDRLAAEAQALAARALATDATLQFLPQFAVQAQYNWQDKAAGFDGKHGSGYVGFGVSLPLFDGGVMIQNAREASARRRQAEAHVLTVRQQVTTEVMNAWDSWMTATAAVPIAKREVELSQENHRLVEVRYKAGTARQVEVLDAVAMLRAGELGLLRAQAQATLAAAELLSAAGRLAER